MRTLFSVILAALLLILTSSCIPAPEYRVTGTVKDIMDAVVDPNADFLWNSVATIEDAKGVVEKAPKTDDDWKELRRHAVTLMEAADLLQIPGRSIARPGEKSENPEVELSPEVIKTLVDSDRASWIKYNHGLHDATALMLKAIDAKDVAGVSEAGDILDRACEACHKHYWYPEKLK